MAEAEGEATVRNGELSRGRIVLLGFFLALLMGNKWPIASQIYIQLVLLAGFFVLYSLSVLMSLRLWKVTPAMALGMVIAISGFALSSLIQGFSVSALGTMTKYFLAMASFPIFIAFFSPASQPLKDRMLEFYAILVLVFTVVTEWGALVTWTKPDLKFLGGYNGANLHFLVLASFFLIRSLFRPGKGTPRLLHILPAVLFLILVAATQSRQSVLLTGFLLVYIVLAMIRQGRVKLSNILPILIVPAAFAALAVVGGVLERFIFEARGLSANKPISSMERFLMLLQFWDGLDWTRLWIGFGYDAVIRKFEGTSESVHLGYLQLIFNGGLILLAGFGTVFMSAMRRYSHPGGPRRMLLVTFLAANLFDSHFFSFQVLWLPALVLALFPDEFPAPSSAAPAPPSAPFC